MQANWRGVFRSRTTGQANLPDWSKSDASTAQGFEYDYAGVIFGRDLVWRPRKGWIGQPEFSHDSIVKRAAKEDLGRFTDLVKNTYRVLLTRGMKGCSVHFLDEDTRSYFLSRMESE